MPTIDEVTNKLMSLDDNKYNAAVSYIFYLAETPVEVSISIDNPPANNSKVKLLAGGSLKKYANPSLIDQEKEAWRKAVIEKYEKNNA